MVARGGMRRGLLPWSTLLAAGCSILLDRVSKWWVVENLPLGEPRPPIPAIERWFSFTYIHNTGAAFGMLPQGKALFAAVAVVAVLALARWYDRLPVDHLPVRIAVGLIMGGALGNLIDRLTVGYVIDFLDFKFWPVFNIADSSLVVGVLVLTFYLLREGERPQGERLKRSGDVECSRDSVA